MGRLKAQSYVVFATRGQVIETRAKRLPRMLDKKISSQPVQARCGDNEILDSASD